MVITGCGSMIPEPATGPIAPASSTARPDTAVAESMSDSPTTTAAAAPDAPREGARPGPSSADASTSAAAEPSAGGTLITTAESQYGQILFDGRGQAIYLFDREQSTQPDCYTQCAVAWPPVLTVGSPRAGAGAQPGLIATPGRSDGSTQVTYGGHPLYYYAAEGPNQVTCHNVREYGGRWLVVTPRGAAAA
jgi:predicted lipoprotein with Yx(FWY)xxD motif